jgi:hypothetical protein
MQLAKTTVDLLFNGVSIVTDTPLLEYDTVLERRMEEERRACLRLL